LTGRRRRSKILAYSLNRLEVVAKAFKASAQTSVRYGVTVEKPLKQVKNVNLSSCVALHNRMLAKI
jgi:hypothetical protein